ncbi:MAG: response regulator [Clostridia bacterium]|nr:response regulator [Clostridia bacterium]
MFTPFEREKTSTVSKIEGTGLGLSICKSLIDQMNGTIEVNTELGKGTSFTLKLKFELANEADVPKPEIEEITDENKHVELADKRVLLVEDNMINMEIAKMILTQSKLIVETAENGQIAVDMVSSSKPGYYDIILMDVQMPVMDGYTATKNIRQLENKELASIPILAMTANAFKEDEEAALACGMQGHVAKPIDVAVLISTLEKTLQG